MTGKVFFVPTPIGNLGDMTFRAVKTLQEVDVIFCEDTRHSLPLLTHFDIKKPLKSFHKFNEMQKMEGVFEMLEQGKNLAFLSDAGMPGISDPGQKLICQLIERGVEYTVLTGACAFVNAFVMSGFNAPMTFVGFLPEKNKQRQRLLQRVSTQNTLIFYSAVHNVNDDLKFLFDFLGDRRVAVVKEISKMYESCTIQNLSQAVVENPRGEFVLVVEEKAEDSTLDMTVRQNVEFLMQCGVQKNEAIKTVAKERGLHKNQVYQEMIED